MDINVAILAYNEEQNLEMVTNEVSAMLKTIPGDHEIIIVNDGSSDQTGEVAKRLALENGAIRVLEHTQNLGLGGAYRTGFAEARGDLLTFWPADGQFDPEIIRRFVAVMDGVDLVLGYLPNRQRGFLPGMLSLGERALYRILFGKIPRFQGVLMLKTELLNKIQLTSEGRGWAVILEFIIKASRNNCRIMSIPTGIRLRETGSSKVTNIRTIASNFKQIIELRARI